MDLAVALLRCPETDVCGDLLARRLLRSKYR
jgi:hypothetical protein